MFNLHKTFSLKLLHSFVVLISTGVSKPPCEPLKDTCMYTVNASHYFDAEIQCREQFDGTLSYGENAEHYSGSHKVSFLQWIGLRKNGSSTDWFWTVDDSRLNSNSTSLPWANAVDANADSVNDQCVAVFEGKWYIFNCLTRHNYALCQRPKRNYCHTWNLSRPCLWLNAECERQVLTRNHKGDDESPCATDLSKNASMSCSPDQCRSCKYSPWSPWSKCQPYCQPAGNYTRFRFDFNNDSECSDVANYKSCTPDCCETSVGRVSNQPPLVATETSFDYDNEQRDVAYGEAVFNWLIITVVVVIAGSLIVVGLIVYQKMQRKYNLHRKLIPLQPISATGSVSVAGECKHAATSKVCHCKSTEVSATMSLDKLGYWCH